MQRGDLVRYKEQYRLPIEEHGHQIGIIMSRAGPRSPTVKVRWLVKPKNLEEVHYEKEDWLEVIPGKNNVS